MLGFFSAKSDHPLADAREMRRVLEELLNLEPSAALNESKAWLESLGAAEDMKADQRLDLILRLDEATLPHARRLGRDFLTAPLLTRAQEQQLWACNHGYWMQLASAYDSCFQKVASGDKEGKSLESQLHLLLVRLLCTHASSLKWVRFRYGQLDGRMWQTIGQAYLKSLASGLAQKNIAPYPNTREITIEQEYLKTLALHSSAVDNLLPLEIEIADRLIVYLLPRLIFTSQQRPDSVHFVDAAKPLPPARLFRTPEPSTTLRFISPADALDALAGIRHRIEQTGAVPAEIQLGGQYPADVVLSVLDHLVLNWQPTPPQRNHTRHPVKSKLAVINGFAVIHARLAGTPTSTDDIESSGNIESWTTTDVSIGGMGSLIPSAANDWMRISALVGIRPEGGDNWLIGVVRRFNRGGNGTSGSVGVETVGKNPRAIIADSDGLDTLAILLDATQAGLSDTLDLALSNTAYEGSIPLVFALDGQPMRLHAEAIIENGFDFLIARYRVVT